MFNFKKHGMKKNYVTTAVALLLLAGCSNDIKETDIPFTGDTGAKVSFSAVITIMRLAILLQELRKQTGRQKTR